jgi:hypothetical protein
MPDLLLHVELRLTNGQCRLWVKTSPTSYRAYVSSRQVQQIWPPRERGTFTPLLPPDADRPARTHRPETPGFAAQVHPGEGLPTPDYLCASRSSPAAICGAPRSPIWGWQQA